jgi:hypothetical protein
MDVIQGAPKPFSGADEICLKPRSAAMSPIKQNGAVFQEGIMTKFVWFVAIAFVFSISSAEANKKKTPVSTASSTPVQNGNGTKNSSLSKGRGSRGAPMMQGCHMSGNC